jgi:tRNA (cytidine/uridine-2'-O-)-methyltransferase
MTFDVVLYQPEIPGNTGNITRLCANTGVTLHLVRPLGFSMTDKQMKRAGLDYHEYANVHTHDHWESCRESLRDRRCFAVTTKGSTRYSDIEFIKGDVFVFGPETRGMPLEMLALFTPERRLRLPMRPGSRSLNLANSAAVLVFEAWRQVGFVGGI